MVAATIGCERRPKPKWWVSMVPSLPRSRARPTRPPRLHKSEQEHSGVCAVRCAAPPRTPQCPEHVSRHQPRDGPMADAFTDQQRTGCKVLSDAHAVKRARLRHASPRMATRVAQVWLPSFQYTCEVPYGSVRNVSQTNHTRAQNLVTASATRISLWGVVAEQVVGRGHRRERPHLGKRRRVHVRRPGDHLDGKLVLRRGAAARSDHDTEGVSFVVKFFLFSA